MHHDKAQPGQRAKADVAAPSFKVAVKVPSAEALKLVGKLLSVVGMMLGKK